ncbi:MAG: cation diffusion facilitator family transporter [Candidatus Saelkia tenebricola]|nr:cation diffusion facilitator family transporter [Candidatus Saelkia tenebricola]
MNEIDKRISKANCVTWTGFIVNIFLMVFKLIAGITGKSSAMIADAFHSLSDFVTDIIVLLGFKVVKKPIDKSHDYGHGKVETLVTTIVGIVLVGVGIKILYSGSRAAVIAIQGYVFPPPGLIALYAAVVSILAKEMLYRYTIKVGNKINSQALIVNAWHHRLDAFTSIATLIGISGAIVLGEKWRVLDPIAAIVVSFFIMRTAIIILKGSINELIDASLPEETENEILGIVNSVSLVKNPHNMKTRRLGNNVAIDIHIEVDKSLNVTQAHDVATEVEKKLKESFGKNTFISVHIEPFE